MSATAEISILSVDGQNVRCLYRAVHPDEAAPDHPNYAIQIVVDLYESLRNGHVFEAEFQSFPFDKAAAKTIASTHPFRETMEEWLELLRGKKVEISRSEFDQLRSATGQRGISSLSSAGGVYYKTLDVDGEAVAKHVAANFKNYEMVGAEAFLVDEDVWYERFDSSNPPTCELRFSVTDPSLLFHVVPGCRWQSAFTRHL